MVSVFGLVLPKAVPIMIANTAMIPTRTNNSVKVNAVCCPPRLQSLLMRFEEFIIQISIANDAVKSLTVLSACVSEVPLRPNYLHCPVQVLPRVIRQKTLELNSVGDPRKRWPANPDSSITCRITKHRGD